MIAGDNHSAVNRCQTNVRRRGLSVNRAVRENPSVSPFGLTAPLSGEPRRLRRSGRQVGDPYSWRYKTRCDCHSSDCTPSDSPFGLPAPPEVEPRVLRTRKRREAKSLPYGWRCETIGTHPSSYHTPSASLCSAAPSKREPRVLRTRERRAAKSRPYGWRCKTNRYTPFIVPHPLSFAFAQQLPQRWSQGGSAAAGARACKLSRQ